MCEMCERVQKKTGEQLPELISSTVHHLKDLISWIDKTKDILTKGDAIKFNSAGIKVLKTLEVFSFVNLIFIDLIMKNDDLDFADFLLMMLHSVVKNKDQITKIEKGIMSDPDSVKKIKDLLESLQVKDTAEDTDHRFN